MLHVPAYTHERRPYSATWYPISFTLDSLLALTISAQCKTYDGWCSTPGPMASGEKRCAGVVGTRTNWVLKGVGGGMTTLLLQYVARFDEGGRDCWVWRGRLQGQSAVVLPVCRAPVSICCAKRRATSFTHVLERDKLVYHFLRFRPHIFLRAERCS